MDQLRYGHFGHGTAPAFRADAVGRVWQRHGLSVGGARYAAGVSTHAPTGVTIDLNRSCTTFRSSVGVDDLTHGLGSLRFSVYGDHGPLWSSPVVEGGQPAVPVSVDIAGQRAIRLVVEARTPFGVVAVADWAGARISCG